MQPWIWTFKQLWKQMCLMLKMIIRGKRQVRTLPLYPSSWRNPPLLSVSPSLGAIFEYCIAERFWPRGMETCIQKGRQTGQRKLSTDYSTPITWERVKRIYFVNKSDYVPRSYPLSKNDSLRENNIAASPRWSALLKTGGKPSPVRGKSSC